VRHAIAAEADPDFMFRDDFNRGIALLHRAGRGAGLRFDLLLVPPNLGRASSFVDRHPNLHDWVSELSRHERNRILGETAIEAYGW
jgi:predicted TIM-barrel fold metal-dependent hydrolase